MMSGTPLLWCVRALHEFFLRDTHSFGHIPQPDGEAGLAGYSLELFSPLQPMLAQSAADPKAALAKTGMAAVEYKIDGARIQVHRRAGDIRVYTRNLRDITDWVPEVVEATAVLDVESIILDGEAIALHDDQRPRPFQVTMSRFGRQLDVASGRAETGNLTPQFS